MTIAPYAVRSRGAVKINGATIQGWTRFEVENNSAYSADTFRVELAGQLLPSDRNLSWFSQQQDMFVELFIGNPADPISYRPEDLTSWVYGQVDCVKIDPVENVIELSGRDLTRVFIDSKTFESFSNQTSSQIATALANRHGLTPVVTATTTKAGKYFDIDHVNTNAERSEWDLLNFLATVEDFQVQVQGQNLYFGPAQSGTALYPLEWKPPGSQGAPSAAVESLRLERALTVSRGVQVSIHSWNAKYAKGFTVTYPGKAPKTINVGGSAVGAGIQVYRRTIRNLTQQEALQRAEALYNQIISHEMTLEFHAPGDNSLTLAAAISLSGTGTAFDQVYYPDHIRRTMDCQSGYSMEVHAKNHGPDTGFSAV